MTDFKLLCCRLFEQYPLYDYRTAQPDSNLCKLNVLIVGSGSRIEPILHEILKMGQLMDTELDITVATSNAKSFIEKNLTGKAPHLMNFARILLNNEVVSAPHAAMQLCTIRVNRTNLSTESMENILEKNFDCSYVFISTGKDDVNYSMAESCSQYIPDQKTLIAYVQRKLTKEITAANPNIITFVPFGFGKTEEYRSQLENIAFNLHYAYSNSGNERKNVETIRKEFDDPYIYLSNIEAALHIRSKLACVGITDSSTEIAANKFFHLMSSHPEIIERLSVVEHSRWMMSKLLNGYRPLDDINLIYSGDITTHNSGDDKWHCCLVPCDRTGKSCINAKDWETAEEGKPYRKSLDALDVMSLDIHRKCGEIAAERASDINSQLEMLRTALSNNNNFSPLTKEALNDLESAIVQMNLKKKTAIPIYRQAWKKLYDLIKKEGGNSASVLLSNLVVIDSALAPLREYISYKDYKQQDRLQINQIPYILTNKGKPVLLKLISSKESDNLFSAWQLEARRLIYVGIAESIVELRQLHNVAVNSANFLKKSIQLTDLSYYIFVSEKILNNAKKECQNFHDWNCTITPISEWTSESLSETLSSIIREADIDYLDVTGSDPLLSKAAESLATKQNIAIFYCRSGYIRNLQGAEELEYPAPSKSITVKEMFDISGAVLRKSESTGKSDLMTKYTVLWNIAKKHYAHWDGFCRMVGAAHKSIQSLQLKFVPNPFSFGEQIIEITEVAPQISALSPMLIYLKNHNYIKDLSVTNTFGGQCTLSVIVNKQKVKPEDLKGYLQDCCRNYHPHNFFHHEYDNGILIFTYMNLDVVIVSESLHNNSTDDDSKSKDTPFEVYKTILKSLFDERLILDYKYKDSKRYPLECSFRFASKDVLTCIQSTGAILEYYIYYTALLDSNFTDVDMGYEFAHSSAIDSAQNEIDIICTKGNSSLFISAKMVTQKKLKDKFNYVLYEIILLADRFGLNAKPVLAAPVYDQFDFDKKTNSYVLSSKVQSALQRGVYLLGEECFTSGHLGEILDNIAEGKDDWCGCAKPKKDTR